MEFRSNNFYDEVLFESSDFFAVPSVGAIVSGWILIVPKRAILNFSQLSKSEVADAIEFISFIRNEIERAFGKKIVLFEHGPAFKGSSTGCSVDYAHLHLVPTQHDLLDDPRVDKFNWRSFNNLNELNGLVNPRMDYLLYRSADGEYTLTQRSVFESQVFRKIIAAKEGRPNEFNWRDYPHEDNIKSTIDSLTLEPVNRL